jgi:hypothetical protein
MSKIDMDRVLEAAQNDEDVGFCVACGAEQSGVEPDARGCECEACGKRKVYGAEEIFLMGACT